MSSPQIGQTFNTFQHLLRELEPFVDVQDIRLSFDRHGNAFLTASDFSVQLEADLRVVRKVREEMRQIIAIHRGLQASS